MALKDGMIEEMRQIEVLDTVLMIFLADTLCEMF